MSKRNKKLKKKGFDWKDTERFDKTASEVGGALGNLESQLTQLKAEIRADEDGIFDFDSRLGFLYKEREMLETRVKLVEAEPRGQPAPSIAPGHARAEAPSHPPSAGCVEAAPARVEAAGAQKPAEAELSAAACTGVHSEHLSTHDFLADMSSRCDEAQELLRRTGMSLSHVPIAREPPRAAAF